MLLVSSFQHPPRNCSMVISWQFMLWGYSLKFRPYIGLIYIYIWYVPPIFINSCHRLLMWIHRQVSRSNRLAPRPADNLGSSVRSTRRSASRRRSQCLASSMKRRGYLGHGVGQKFCSKSMVETEWWDLYHLSNWWISSIVSSYARYIYA